MTRPVSLIVANWKANLPPGEEVALAASIAGSLVATERVQVLIAPSLLGLVPVTSLLRREHSAAGIATAAQDCSSEESGAHTGEVPAVHVAGIAEAIIVGHSERRRERGESSEVVGRKAARVVLAGLRPILCVGDDLAGADDAERAAVVIAQWRDTCAGAAQLGVTEAALLAAGLTFAYEPVWAIGSGRPATAAQAQQVAGALRAVISAELPVLYGGSVDAEGAAEFLAMRGIPLEQRLSGLLVGGASLSAPRFAAIVAAAAHAVAESD